MKWRFSFLISFFFSQFSHVGTGPCSFLIRVELIVYDLTRLAFENIPAFRAQRNENMLMHLTAILATDLSSRYMHCDLLTCHFGYSFEFSVIEFLPVHLPRPTSSKRPARLMIVCFLCI